MRMYIFMSENKINWIAALTYVDPNLFHVSIYDLSTLHAFQVFWMTNNLFDVHKKPIRAYSQPPLLA